MTTPSQVEAIFFAALGKKTRAEQAGYLDQACGEDAELRHRVERLLEAHPQAANFLARPALDCHGLAADDTAEDTVGFALSSASERVGEAPAGRPAAVETLADEHGDEDDNVLDVLQPSEKRGSIGRLAHYEVLEVLGKGSFGTVVKAYDEKLHRLVAIKVMSPLLASTSASRKRFLREARSAAAVRHPNVVAIHAVEDQPIPYLVMEYIAGETLQQKLEAIGPLGWVEVLRIGRQIACGLAAAHGMGLIHRDIKPSNILLENGIEHVKITDFGLARTADDASITQSGLISGTPMYMAPEQALGETIDQRADLFSLGSVLYVMCSGRPPFRAASTLAVLKRVTDDTPRPIREIVPEVPEWLCDLIARLHAKKPVDRFASAQEVADRLARHLAELQRPEPIPPIPAVPPSAAEKMQPPGELPDTTPPIRRLNFRNGCRVGFAAVLLMLIGGFGFTEATGVTDFRGTVIRLFTPDGTLVVEVDDPAVSVKVDGSEIVITGSGAREIRLKPGQYKVEASKNGKLVRQELVDVTRNSRPVVRITREVPPEGTKAAEATADASTWERSVAVLPALEQVKTVAARLKERNPGFDGVVVPTIENGVVIGLKLTTDQVTDLSPVRALIALKSLDCSGSDWDKGRLIDLSPLRGLLLTHLNCGFTRVSDLAPLQGMPLKDLSLWQTKVFDLASLQGMPLEYLVVGCTGVSDLSPLKGMSLTLLWCHGTRVTDLTPLHGMPLKNLDLYHVAGVTNLQPLQGLPLEYLNLDGLPASDLSVLKGMTSLQVLFLEDMPVSDLTPLQGLKLKELSIKGDRVADLSLLKTFPLTRLHLDYRADREELLRSIKGLERINHKPAAEFWKEVDAKAKVR